MERIHFSAYGNEEKAAAQAGNLRLTERGWFSESGDKVLLRLDKDAPADGFSLCPVSQGMALIGRKPIHLLNGVGWLLRQLAKGTLLPSLKTTQTPACPLRGVYFARHFHNFYHTAPVEEIRRYLEDLALWGFCYFSLPFPRINLEREDSPETQKQLEQVASLLSMAASIGFHTASFLSVNDGYRNEMEEFPFTPVPDPYIRHGNSGNMLCPSLPGAQERIDHHNRVFLSYMKEKGVPLELLCVWPYDEGGCGCEKCAPWGANGYLRGAKRAFQVAKEYYPDALRMVSTWTFDTPYQGEWEALSRSLESEHWCDVILADSHEDFPRYPLEKGVPGGLPMVSFPEISMWGLNPWGGFGATALPKRFTRLWRQTQGKLAGEFLYSEGIFEDLNKAVISQLCWKGDVEPEETVAEYGRYELGLKDVSDFCRMVELLEQNHTQAAETGFCDPAAAQEAFEMAQKVNKQLSPFFASCWRWRILYLRTLLDARRFQLSQGKASADWKELLKQDKPCQDAFREIISLFHCWEKESEEDPYHSRVRPPCD